MERNSGGTYTQLIPTHPTLQFGWGKDNWYIPNFGEIHSVALLEQNMEHWVAPWGGLKRNLTGFERWAYQIRSPHQSFPSTHNCYWSIDPASFLVVLKIGTHAFPGKLSGSTSSYGIYEGPPWSRFPQATQSGHMLLEHFQRGHMRGLCWQVLQAAMQLESRNTTGRHLHKCGIPDSMSGAHRGAWFLQDWIFGGCRFPQHPAVIRSAGQPLALWNRMAGPWQVGGSRFAPLSSSHRRGFVTRPGQSLLMLLLWLCWQGILVFLGQLLSDLGLREQHHGASWRKQIWNHFNLWMCRCGGGSTSIGVRQSFES